MSRHPLFAVAAVGLGTLVALPAAASIAPECQDVVVDMSTYNEQRQQDFLMNYYALNATYSPVHGPIPHAAGRGALGVKVNGLIPLPCERRFALGATKTEDTNVAPALPQLHGTYAFPALFDVVIPFAGFAFLPPVEVAGTRNFVASGEVGAGIELEERWQLALRFHFSSQRTVGDVATKIEDDDPDYDDLFLGTTMGADLSFGARLTGDFGEITPFVSVGLVDASTFFWVGDSGVVTNNYHPYFGLAYSVGADALFIDKIRVGVEYYGAPGGFVDLRPSTTVEGDLGHYGRVHTWRTRIAYEF